MTDFESQLQALVQRHLDRFAEAGTGIADKAEIEKKYFPLALASDFAIDTLCQQPAAMACAGSVEYRSAGIFGW